MKRKVCKSGTVTFAILEIRVSQNLVKLGGEAHKMSGMEGG